MRVATRFRIVTATIVGALLVLGPLLIWTLNTFKLARNNYALAEAIKTNFFERTEYRDQYFLYHEERLRVQWESNKARSDALLRRAKTEFHDQNVLQLLERLRVDIDATADLFHRIVSNTEVLKTVTGNKQVYEEFDKRLNSQLLLRASDIREEVTELRQIATLQIERAYEQLLLVVGLYTVALVIATLLISTQIGNFIRRRLAPVHQGAEIIANGNLDHRIATGNDDEFADLAHSINAMTAALRTEIEAHLKTEARLQFIVENDLVGICTIKNRIFQWANPACEKALRYEKGELNGAPTRLLYKDDASYVAMGEEYFAALSSGQMFQTEQVFLRKDGQLITVNLNGSVLNPDTGESLWVLVDITERKQVERVTEQYHSVIQASLDGFWVTDLNGRILEANESICRMHRYTSDELIGLTIRDIEADETPEDTAAHMREMIAKGHVQFEARHKCKDGTIIEVEVSILYVKEIGEYFYAFIRDITERKQADKQVQEAAQYARSLLEASLDPLVTISAEGKITDVNIATEQVTGVDRNQLVGSDFADYFTEPDKARMGYQQVFSLGYVTDYPLAIRHVSGLVTDVLYNANVYRDRHGNVRGVFAAARNITERKKAEEKLQLAASVFSHAREGIMITDPHGSILDVNETFTHITGYSRSEVLGQNPRLLSSGRHSAEYYAAMWHDLIEVGFWSGEVWNRRKNGEVYAELQTVSAVKDEQGNTLQYVSLFSDITPLKEHERQLEHIAHFDALTGLPNRVLLADRLHQAMTQTQRRGQPLAVAYLDLDGFKAINDEHGHDAGDQLLIAVASRMKQTLRDGDTLARLGGDEFVAIFTDLVDIKTSAPIYTRLLEAVALPVHFKNKSLQVSASVGVTFYPQAEPLDADQLLRQADQAMYQAKLAGKNRFHLFDTEQDRTVRGYHESLERLQQALQQNEFVLYYQPKVAMRTGQVVGAEALIRWQHPERGLVPPLEFLPVIETHAISIELGEWVIATALGQMEAWRPAGLEMPVSVNISALHLQQNDFKDRLSSLLAAHPSVNPGFLQLEILETSALADIDHVSRVMQDCLSIGVNFALDDFGTGYSSLTYLKRLPASVLKIDQSFVRDMLDDPEDLAILNGVLGLASAFSRQVIAEGVESVEQGRLLLQLGCDLAQGYCIARPMPAGDLPDWVKGWQTDPAWSNVVKVSQDDLSLLFANVGHRAWINHIKSFLNEERSHPPAMDHHTCLFGIWLEVQELKRQDMQAFKLIESLHNQLHAQAKALLALHATGAHLEALDRLRELRALSEALVAQVGGLQRANQ